MEVPSVAANANHEGGEERPRRVFFSVCFSCTQRIIYPIFAPLCVLIASNMATTCVAPGMHYTATAPASQQHSCISSSDLRAVIGSTVIKTSRRHEICNPAPLGLLGFAFTTGLIRLIMHLRIIMPLGNSFLLFSQQSCKDL